MSKQRYVDEIEAALSLLKPAHPGPHRIGMDALGKLARIAELDTDRQRAAFDLGYEAARGEGLSRRDAFAKAAMQGILAEGQMAGVSEDWMSNVARESVQLADALIAALDSETP